MSSLCLQSRYIPHATSPGPSYFACFARPGERSEARACFTIVVIVVVVVFRGGGACRPRGATAPEAQQLGRTLCGSAPARQLRRCRRDHRALQGSHLSSVHTVGAAVRLAGSAQPRAPRLIADAGVGFRCLSGSCTRADHGRARQPGAAWPAVHCGSPGRRLTARTGRGRRHRTVPGWEGRAHERVPAVVGGRAWARPDLQLEASLAAGRHPRRSRSSPRVANSWLAGEGRLRACSVTSLTSRISSRRRRPVLIHWRHLDVPSRPGTATH